MSICAELAKLREERDALRAEVERLRGDLENIRPCRTEAMKLRDRVAGLEAEVKKHEQFREYIQPYVITADQVMKPMELAQERNAARREADQMRRNAQTLRREVAALQQITRGEHREQRRRLEYLASLLPPDPVEIEDASDD